MKSVQFWSAKHYDLDTFASNLCPISWLPILDRQMLLTSVNLPKKPKQTLPFYVKPTDAKWALVQHTQLIITKI